MPETIGNLQLASFITGFVIGFVVGALAIGLTDE